MEGDPYCQHCGAHLKWDYDDEEHIQNENVLKSTYSKPDHFLDYGEISETYHNDEKLDYIADSVCITSSQKMLLKAKIREYLKATDCRGFYIKKDYEFEVYYFHFIQENQYVKTTHVMTFLQDPDYFTPYNPFYEIYSLHSHERLFLNPRFKRLVENTGLEFSGCGGGYRLHLRKNYDTEMTDDIKVRVYFNVNGKRRAYNLDLDSMQLSSDY